MKILHMISGGDVGGAKTHVLTLLHGLQQEHEVQLVCFIEGEFAQEARGLGIPTLVYPSRNLHRVADQLTALIRKRQFDVVHCHGSRANIMARLIKRRFPQPFLTTVHSDPWLDYMGRPMSDLVIGRSNRSALKHFDYWVAVSDRTRELLIRRGYDPQRIYTIYNGVDFSNLTPAMDRDAFLDHIGLKRQPDSVIFGIAARISPVKDIPTLLRAFAETVAQEPSVRLVVAGDGEDRGKLEALAAKLCPAGTVVFAGWISDMNSFYNAIDVNCLTSLSETFPYAVTEGARMRCATIATDVGGVPKVVKDGQTGLLLAPGDAEALARDMLLLARDPALRAKLGQGIFDLTRSEFSIDATVRTQEEIYRSALVRQEKNRDWLKREITICGAYGRGNAGDETILAAIIQQFRQRDPDVPICVLSKDPIGAALRNNVRSIYTFSMGKVRRQLRRTRLFVSGGGSLIQDVTSTRSLLYYLWTICAAYRRGNRVMLYGCGIGPVNRRLNRRLAGRIIDRCADIVTLRDPDSQETLTSLGVSHPKVYITADPTLLQGVAAPEQDAAMEQAGLDPKGKYCMFVLRRWKSVRQRLPAFAAAAEYAYRTYGMTPVFFMLEPGKDQAVTQQVMDRIRCPKIALPVIQDGATICAIISKMEMVVSMRLHALIFASGQGVPVAGIVYDPKVSGFLDYLEQANYISAEEVSAGALCDLIDAAASSRPVEGEIVSRLRRLAAKNGELAWTLYNGENC